MNKSKRCARCGKACPTSLAGAINGSGRVCDPCWNKLSDLEAIMFGSLGIRPRRLLKEVEP